MQFNDAQQRAIQMINGPALVVSCPGSGKTTVIVERVHEMIKNGIENILIITFTTNAANQMAVRYRDKYGVLSPNILFGTIHSLCFRVIKRAYGYSKDSFLSEIAAIEFLNV